jgi:hypothetical protein
LAIPFFDACLERRLPPVGSSEQTLRPLNLAQGRTIALPEAVAAGETAWLPSDRLARLYDEYIKTGFVDDATTPPAPHDVVAKRSTGNAIEVTWQVDADLESGLAGFVIERDGEEIGKLPEKPIGKFGKPLFQTMSYHDTPEKPLPEMKFVDATSPAGATPTYRIFAVNAAGLKSEPSASSVAP